MLKRHFSPLGFWLASLVLALCAVSSSAFADPPGRVARVSYLGGYVSMQAAGMEEWSEARINRPLITGDSLYSDRASRVEMEIGAATLRLDERTSFRLLNLDDSQAQFELTSGTASLNVRRVFDGQYYEVDTPTLALVIDRPGLYRIDISPDGDSTMVSVVDGDAEVYGRDNASYSVRGGRAYRFYDDRLRDVRVFDLPREDDFDRWCYERMDRYQNSPSRRYVSEEIIGYADLDDYGSWSTVATYGSIWYPRVNAGWAPYRYGHWSWIDPWGWTWVDNEPWGFAPCHYGRWAYVGSRWGWVPGPRHVRPIYAPALVAFVGGGGFNVGISVGGPVGWFPLGPRDVYVPWYRGSRNYFNNINVHNTTIINNTYITNVYNDYSRGAVINNANYAYRGNVGAFTAVSRDDFVNARSVDRARIQVNQAQLSRSNVVSQIQVAPTARSFVGGSVARADGGRVARNANFDRTVIARTAPPVREMNAQARIQAISRNNNQPLAVSQMQEMSERKPVRTSQGTPRVQVVGSDRSPVGTRAAVSREPADDSRKPISRGNAQSPSVESRGTPTRTQRTEGVQRTAPVESTERTVRAPRNEGRTEQTTAREPVGTREQSDVRYNPSRDSRQDSGPVSRQSSERTVRAPQPSERPSYKDEVGDSQRGTQSSRTMRQPQGQGMSGAREEPIRVPDRRYEPRSQPEQRSYQPQQQQPTRRSEPQPQAERSYQPQQQRGYQPQQERSYQPQQRSEPVQRTQREVQPQQTAPQPRVVEQRQPQQRQAVPQESREKSDSDNQDSGQNQRKPRNW